MKTVKRQLFEWKWRRRTLFAFSSHDFTDVYRKEFAGFVNDYASETSYIDSQLGTAALAMSTLETLRPIWLMSEDLQLRTALEWNTWKAKVARFLAPVPQANTAESDEDTFKELEAGLFKSKSVPARRARQKSGDTNSGVPVATVVKAKPRRAPKKARSDPTEAMPSLARTPHVPC